MSLNQRPSSTSRVRTPATGRSNLKSLDSARSDKISISSSVRERLNDPLEVFRPFSPEARESTPKSIPVLPKSIDPTVPPYVPYRKPKNRMTCPDEWIETLNKPDWVSTADFKTLVDTNAKREYCKGFIERNKDKLWKFDLKYLHKTPQDVCEEIVANPDFIGLIKSYNSREHVLRLNGSDNFASALKDSHLKSLGEITISPPIHSLATSREERNMRLTKLLSPALMQHGHAHMRGFNHTPEYGNFTKFSNILHNNKGATLQR